MKSILTARSPHRYIALTLITFSRLAKVFAEGSIVARMRNLRFGFFDDSGLPRESRILMFYSFDTEENLTRSGILHYHVPEQRFVGPRHDAELTSAALAFLSSNGRIPETAAS
jgi:hypothetical protein